MRNIILTLLVCFSLVAQVTAQSSKLFNPVSFDLPAMKEASMVSKLPTEYQTWQLDYDLLKTHVQSAPKEFTAAARNAPCILEVPTGATTTERFAIWEIAMMDEELAARYPDIKTYGGKSLDSPGKTIRISVTIRGFRAMILGSDMQVRYVEPHSTDQNEYYISYDRKSLPPVQLATLDQQLNVDLSKATLESEPFVPTVEDRNDPSEETLVSLRTLRYTVACTGEFSIDHGGTKPSVLAAVIDYTNKVSAIFERDSDLRLKLTACSEVCIFLDPSTDPFTGNDVGTWMTQNAQAAGYYCGTNNFDVGHVYSKYLGGSAAGVAGGIACTDSKDRGCSSSNLGPDGTYGDWFINVVGQEVGHQLSGGHTWNRCNGGGGRAGSSAYEPGSGSTIMSYGGACGPDNIQGSSDLYFHSGSVGEFLFFFIEGAGSGCGTNFVTDNNAPVVTLPYTDNFFIPISTPFELNGSATDADGDALTYAWEEIDLGPETPLGSPISSVPIFRVWPAGDKTNRYFPKLSTVLSNGTDITEQLPTYTRDMTFRMIARDNRTGGGGVGLADVAFKATASAGPFTVQVANQAGTVWKVGELTNITWDVANTNGSTVNCQKVNIRMSTDGGQTYPITLYSGAGNDGSQYLTVPDNVTTNARLRIDAADNVFYDVSNAKFSIQQPTTPTLTVGITTDVTKICLPSSFTTEIQTAATLGFNTPITLAIDGALPPGAVATFGNSNLSPGQSSSLTIDMSNVTVEGVFTFNVSVTPQGGTPILRPITISTISNNFDALTLTSPIDGSTDLGLTQILYWNQVPDADSYDVQLSNSPSFNTILTALNATSLDSFKMTLLLEKGNDYFWRLRPRNECLIGAWTEPNFFSTYAESCQTFAANDLPKFISPNSTSTTESKITVNQGGTISDINVKTVKGSHTYIKDLDVRLISPLGTEVTLFKDKCGNFNGSFNLGFDDAAALNFNCSMLNTGNFVRPQTVLAPIVGENSTGQWILRAKDVVAGSGGQLNEFKIEFCASVTVVPPVVVKNNLMEIEIGTNKIISNDFLQVTDPNNNGSQLVFTLVTVPGFGQLQKGTGGFLVPGDQFTQADIDAGNIRYFHWGANSLIDRFKFTVTDGEGGFLGTPYFLIQPIGDGVSTDEPGRSNVNFSLFPNPATNQVWVALDQLANTDMQISLFNMTGQLVQHTTMTLGNNRASLLVGQLPKGVYTVKVESDKGIGFKKLIIQ